MVVLTSTTEPEDHTRSCPSLPIAAGGHDPVGFGLRREAPPTSRTAGSTTSGVASLDERPNLPTRGVTSPPGPCVAPTSRLVNNLALVGVAARSRRDATRGHILDGLTPYRCGGHGAEVPHRPAQPRLVGDVSELPRRVEDDIVTGAPSQTRHYRHGRAFRAQSGKIGRSTSGRCGRSRTIFFAFCAPRPRPRHPAGSSPTG